MNTETGHIYTDPDEIGAAALRGEPLVEVSPRVARLVRLGHAAEQEAENRKKRRKAQRASRKKNR